MPPPRLEWPRLLGLRLTKDMLKYVVFELTEPLCSCHLTSGRDWSWWLEASVPGRAKQRGITIKCNKCSAQMVIPEERLQAQLNWPPGTPSVDVHNPFGQKIGGRN